MIETNEVVEVRMRDEHIRDLEEATRREPAHVAEIEEEGTPFPGKGHVEDRIPEKVVHQEGTEAACHWASGMGGLLIGRLVGLLDALALLIQDRGQAFFQS